MTVVVTTTKGAPVAKRFTIYENFRIQHGLKWSPAKFQSDDVDHGVNRAQTSENFVI